MGAQDEPRPPGFFAAFEPNSPRVELGSTRVRAARSKDVLAVARVAAGRFAGLDEGAAQLEGRAAAQVDRFERTLTPSDGSLPGVPRLFVAEAGLDGGAPKVVGYGTLFVFTAELRERAGRDLGLDPAAQGDGQLAPVGWYLGGLVVARAARRGGLGRALTAARLAALDAAGVTEVRFTANARNSATLALHEPFGFQVEARNPRMSGLAFSGGEGLLLLRRKP
ncbi:MAG: GNAT family N-acetyltransferase [Planctomycetota bacterium]|nr:GNAT family N-acetyltransferase [Planctomycetota bacterium]